MAIIEKAGTGLVRIQDYLQEVRMPPLLIKLEGVFFTAQIHRPDFLEQEAFSLNQDLRYILLVLNQHAPKKLSSALIAKYTNFSVRKVRMNLKELISKKLIVQEKKGREVLYGRA